MTKKQVFTYKQKVHLCQVFSCNGFEPSSPHKFSLVGEHSWLLNTFTMFLTESPPGENERYKVMNSEVFAIPLSTANIYCINTKHTFLLNHKGNIRLMLLYNHWVTSDNIKTYERYSSVGSAPPISWSSARLGPDKTICWMTVDSRN